jgi:predicted dehydrogenase
MRIAIVGCGLIGNKRARAIGATDAVVAAVDTNLARAKSLAAAHPDCTAGDDCHAVVAREDVDAVVVATTNDQLAPATLAAIKAGKHVLVEKPAARNAAELEPVVLAARNAFDTNGAIVKVGFNHRFHPALLKSREIIDSGALGPLMFLRARYGHGGRKGMEAEWRGDPAIAGGGEMLDQGVHLIDLSRWILGDFCDVTGQVARYFWNWDVEDNGFAILRTPANQVAFIHASCTEWKNLFSMEIYGRDGKLAIDGLGGSYGVERLAFYKMLPQMGPPETSIWEYPGEDRSWHREWEDFAGAIRDRRQPLGNIEDALQALVIIKKLYSQSGVSTENPAGRTFPRTQ